MRNQLPLSIALLFLFAASCTDQPVGSHRPNLTEVDVAVEMGVDYSSLAAIAVGPARRRLHVRRAANESNDPGKDLSKAEANDIISAGMSVVRTGKASSTDSLSGYKLGVADAKTGRTPMPLADGAAVLATRSTSASTSTPRPRSQQAKIDA